jgi:hypothetical protein
MRRPLLLGLCLAVATSLSLAETGALAEDERVERIGFEGLPVGVAWHPGETHGGWISVHHGFGRTAVVTGASGRRLLLLSPRAASRPAQTFSALVRTVKTFADVDMSVRVRTTARLRTPRPNPWEVGWVMWRYRDDDHFYYFIAKSNGWELGKGDPGYPGGQRFLATSAAPRFAVGRWHTVRVRHVGNRIEVWVNGERLVGFTDRERPYRRGALALYVEDAAALYSGIELRPPRSR